MTDTYDTAGHLITRTTYDSSGTLVSRVDYDADQLSTWREVDATYVGGQLSQRVVTFDDFHREQTTYDLDGTHPWTSLVNDYDQNNRLDYAIGYGADGSSVYHNYDQGSANTYSDFAWSDIVDNYDGTGRLTDEYVYNDDGSATRTHYEVGNPNYVNWYQVLDALGRQNSISYHHADGTALEFVYDVDGSQSYSCYYNLIDANGRTLTRVYLDDDGGSSIVTFNETYSLQPVSYVVDHFDALHRETYKETIFGTDPTGKYARNSSAITYYDVDGSQPWKDVSYWRTSGGQSYASQIDWDDGTSTSATYPVSHTATAATTYDSQGRVVSQTTVYQSTYDHPNRTDYQVSNYSYVGTSASPSNVTSFFYPDAASEASSVKVGFSDSGSSVIATPAFRVGYNQNSVPSYTVLTDPLLNSLYYDMKLVYNKSVSPIDTLYQFHNGITAETTNASAFLNLYSTDGREIDYFKYAGAYTFRAYNQAISGTDPSTDWATYERVYSGTPDLNANKIASTLTTYADHGALATANDYANNQTWTSYSEQHDTLGATTQGRFVNDNGTSTVYLYDPHNLSDIAYQVLTYNAANALTSTQTFYDDGHVVTA